MPVAAKTSQIQGTIRTIASVYDDENVIVTVGQDRVMVSLLPGSKPPAVGDKVLVYDTQSGPIGLALYAPALVKDGITYKHRDTIELAGSGVTIADDFPNDKTVITIGGAAALILGAVSDRFNRANTAAGIGIADTGHAWTAADGIMGINSNRAYVDSLSLTDNRALSTVQTGFADVRVRARLHDNVNGSQVWLRVDAAGNGLLLQSTGASYKLRSYSAALGAYTDLHDYSLDTPSVVAAADDDIEVVLDGDAVRLYRNGRACKPVTSAYNQEAMGNALGADNTTAATFDNFSVHPWLPGEARSIEWHLFDADASTVGEKADFVSRVPFACRIVDFSVRNRANANCSVSVNLKAVDDNADPDTSGAVTLNPAAVDTAGTARADVTDWAGWTVDLARHTVLYPEIVTADPSVTRLYIVLEVVEL